MSSACPMCDEVEDVKDLDKLVPKDQGWIRNMNDIITDMFFQNPIERCLSETMTR
jgi:hypothetical protein